MLGHARSILLALFVALAQATPIPPNIGASLDAHDCLISAGYSWCDATESCVRVWETPCPDRFEMLKPLPIDYLLTGLASNPKTNDYPTPAWRSHGSTVSDTGPAERAAPEFAVD